MSRLKVLFVILVLLLAGLTGLSEESKTEEICQVWFGGGLAVSSFLPLSSCFRLCIDFEVPRFLGMSIFSHMAKDQSEIGFELALLGREQDFFQGQWAISDALFASVWIEGESSFLRLGVKKTLRIYLELFKLPFEMSFGSSIGLGFSRLSGFRSRPVIAIETDISFLYRRLRYYVWPLP